MAAQKPPLGSNEKKPPSPNTGRGGDNPQAAFAKLDALLRDSHKPQNSDASKASPQEMERAASLQDGDRPTAPPPATETMARLFEEQGHLTQARALRQALWMGTPWEISEVGSTPPPTTQKEAKASQDRQEEQRGAREGRVEIEVENKDTLEKDVQVAVRVRWQLPPSALKGAQAALPESLQKGPPPPQVVLRLTATFSSPRGVSKRQFDHPTTEGRGEIVARPLQGRPVWVCASLGVKGATGRFQSAAHSQVVRLP